VATSDKKQPIVIKRVQGGDHGHHGGAWKVAYADFVTAMMAFFLLMWLLGSTNDGQKAGISDWFKNPTGIQGPGGASTSMIKLGGVMDIPKGDNKKRKKETDKKEQPTKKPTDAKSAQVQEVIEIIKAAEKKRLDSLLEVLKAAIEKSQALKPFKDQLLLDITPEGLRIQIVDKENRPMFDLGRARLKSYMRGILREISKIIRKVPNRISIAGHTDATPFTKGYYRAYEDMEERTAYTNWELSADRANAARREMIKHGVAEEKVGRVIGLASSVLFDKQKPKSPVNRRISIIVLNRDTAKSMGLEEHKQVKAKPAEPKAVRELKQINQKRPVTVEELKKLIPEKQMKVR